MKTKRIVVKFRRKRKQKTNYRKRLNLLKSGKLRLVIRRSLKNIIVQIVEYNPEGDKILVSANSNEITKLGWDLNKNNTPACYLTGYLLGSKATKNNIKEAILDTGLQETSAGNRIYACLKGTIDGGLNVPASTNIFPSEDRIQGKHINDKTAQKVEEIKKKIKQ